MNSVVRLAREAIQKLVPYSSARLESQQKGIQLDANESPFWREDQLNRYPHPQPPELRQRLAAFYEVRPSQLLMTRGSDEGIDLLIRAFCEPRQDALMITPPTYGMYEVAAHIQGVEVLRVPLDPALGFNLNKEEILALRKKKLKLLFICSPNNPTGTLFAREDLLALCEAFQHQALVVLDEAYIEFSSSKSLSAFVSQYPNLVVLRTLSKAFGLAGARLGSLIANPEVIELLSKILAPYPIPVPVERAALQALSAEQLERLQQQIQMIRSARAELSSFLSGLESVTCVYPSETNFLLLKVDQASKWMARCQAHQITIRNRDQLAGLQNCVRITIGTPEENERLKEVLSNDKAKNSIY